MKLKIIFVFLISTTIYACVLGAIAQNRQEKMAFRQDEPESAGEEGGDKTEPDPGPTETTTPDPETLTGTDRFLYGFNALVKAFEVFFSKIDKKVAKKVMAYEDFLNLIHDQVHVNGTEDFHETAYITMKV